MLNLCKISYCCVSRIDTLKYIVRGFLDVRGVWVSDLYPRYQFVMSPYTLPHCHTLPRYIVLRVRHILRGLPGHW